MSTTKELARLRIATGGIVDTAGQTVPIYSYFELLLLLERLSSRVDMLERKLKKENRNG